MSNSGFLMGLDEEFVTKEIQKYARRHEDRFLLLNK